MLLALSASNNITSIITAGAARELRVKKGQTAAALIKSTEVMIVVPWGSSAREFSFLIWARAWSLDAGDDDPTVVG